MLRCTALHCTGHELQLQLHLQLQLEPQLAKSPRLCGGIVHLVTATPAANLVRWPHRAPSIPHRVMAADPSYSIYCTVNRCSLIRYMSVPRTVRASIHSGRSTWLSHIYQRDIQAMATLTAIIIPYVSIQLGPCTRTPSQPTEECPYQHIIYTVCMHAPHRTAPHHPLRTNRLLSVPLLHLPPSCKHHLLPPSLQCFGPFILVGRPAC